MIPEAFANPPGHVQGPGLLAVEALQDLLIDQAITAYGIDLPATQGACVNQSGRRQVILACSVQPNFSIYPSNNSSHARGPQNSFRQLSNTTKSGQNSACPAEHPCGKVCKVQSSASRTAPADSKPRRRAPKASLGADHRSWRFFNGSVLRLNKNFRSTGIHAGCFSMSEKVSKTRKPQSWG